MSLQPTLNHGGGPLVYPHEIEHSALFDDDGAMLYRTPTIAGDSTILTMSMWVKRNNDDDYTTLLSAGLDANNYTEIDFFGATNHLSMFHVIGGSTVFRWESTSEFIDQTGWYNIVVCYDSNQAAPEDRIRAWVNGIPVVGGYVLGSVSLSYSVYLNNTFIHGFGRRASTVAEPAKVYMALPHILDGISVPDANAFGELSQSVDNLWVPKKYTGVYGTNGACLDLSDAASLGKDASGNGNDFTLQGTLTQTVDTPTNNHATWNPHNKGANVNLFLGNTRMNCATTNTGVTTSTLSFDAAEDSVEMEFYVTEGSRAAVGIRPAAQATNNSVLSSDCLIYIGYNGNFYENNTGTAYGTTWGDGDTVKAIVSGGELSFEVNGVSQGVATSGLTGRYTFEAENFSTAGWADITIISTTLTSANLPEPEIRQTSKFADVLLRQGTGVAGEVNTLNFSPDLLNIKHRDYTHHWYLQDSLRGPTKTLNTNTTVAETEVVNGVMEFLPNGYALGDNHSFNKLDNRYLDLALKADPKVGLDIVKYSGDGIAGRGIPHTLGKKPTFILVKNLTTAYDWAVYHADIGATQFLRLNTSDAASTNAAIWNNTEPNSTHFSVGDSLLVNAVDKEYIAYVFTDSDVFKAFSYIGNGSANGPFIPLGGKPLSVPFLKNSSSGYNWINQDAVRNTHNPITLALSPNTSQADSVAQNLNLSLHSIGMKAGGTNVTWNQQGALFVGLAIMQSDQKYSNAF